MAIPEVQVGYFWRKDRSRFVLRWVDPVTKRTRSEATKLVKDTKRNRDSAAKLAMAKSLEICSQWNSAESETTWEQFRALYESERLSRKSIGNARKFRSAANIFETVMAKEVFGIVTLADITPRRLITVEAAMREGLAPGSVPSYMATLRASFSYAAKAGLMHLLPPRMPDDTVHELPAMRLSPIVWEAMQRMQKSAFAVMGKQHGQAMAEYIECLWRSGARLMEPLNMHAYRVDCHHPIVLNGERPLFGWVNSQKNRRDQIAPITLDFAEFLQPLVGAREYLFQPTCEHGPITVDSKLSDCISAIGKAANVIAEPGEKPKTATAKHFRSSLVTRWSRRGMPIERIQSIVRHASRSTTEKHYLAPLDPAAIAGFCELDWKSNQTSNQKASAKSETV